MIQDRRRRGDGTLEQRGRRCTRSSPTVIASTLAFGDMPPPRMLASRLAAAPARRSPAPRATAKRRIAPRRSSPTIRAAAATDKSHDTEVVVIGAGIGGRLIELIACWLRVKKRQWWNVLAGACPAPACLGSLG